MKPEVRITITEEGKVITEIVGVSGPQCEDLLTFLDKIGEIEEDRHTPDYYQGTNVGGQVRQY